MKPLVIYHANCTDGFTAAWVAARALGDVELFPGFYGQEAPDVSGRDVYVLDFSYQRPIMERLVARAAKIVMLDHHRTAEADLTGLVRNTDDRAALVFDMERSGARLAYDWFVDARLADRASEGAPPRPLRQAAWLVNYVQDRDLWRWELPESRFVSAAIDLVPKTLEAWDELAERNIDDLIAEGRVVERYRAVCVAAAVDLARPCMIGGHRVPAANTSEVTFASDVAHQLAKGQPFAATYWVRQDGIVRFSLRSRAEGIDVSEVAKLYGGGGHKHAAGFQVSHAHLLKMLGGGA